MVDKLDKLQIECQASKDSPSCSTCNKIALQAIGGITKSRLTPEDQGVFSEAVIKQVMTFADTTFPASMVNNGAISCADRRRVVTSTAVELTQARLK